MTIKAIALEELNDICATYNEEVYDLLGMLPEQDMIEFFETGSFTLKVGERSFVLALHITEIT